MAHHQFCTFYLADLLFGVPVVDVQEIIKHADMTPVPSAPACVEGLLNLRGQIITCIDLRVRMQLEKRTADHLPMHLIVRHHNGTGSLLVDRVGDVEDLDDDIREDVPDTVDEGIRELITCVYKLKDQFMLILDVERVVDLTMTSAQEKES